MRRVPKLARNEEVLSFDNGGDDFFESVADLDICAMSNERDWEDVIEHAPHLDFRKLWRHRYDDNQPE